MRRSAAGPLGSTALDPDDPGADPETDPRAAAYRRWERSAELPLMAAAVVFLAAYSWEVLADLHGRWWRVASIVQWLTWVVFVVDYVGRLVLVTHRRRWVLRHLVDLAIVLLPMLRPLRLLRLVTLLSIFQRSAGVKLHGRVVVYICGSTLSLVYVAGLAVLQAERHAPHATIRSFGLALWWAATTITTVGYGDLYPVTVTGRCVAVALMIGGIALVGMVTATIASMLLRRIAQQDDAEQAATRAQVQALSDRIGELTELLAQRRSVESGADGGHRAGDAVTVADRTG
ncbi:potassium channel family protein [Nakamurella endophytica]|uniref:Voltage-gated potassium channel n=1 Tax=Nakamurella endophytica TaxID=1748367 RepID=A0A917SWQ1_9ACTN|nr:potassium channel family protein [Nakamurella endophytica]GGL99961.1 voltage-gated potassium channel [Nakamurella endophytica]